MIIVSYYRNIFQASDYQYIGVAVFATLYSYSWDLVMDWGLLRGTQEGKNGWLLRDRLKFPPIYYYFSILTNLILRFSWTLTLIPTNQLPTIM